MTRSILVPLDGSTFGEHALPVAQGLARRGGARLHLVHVHVPQAGVSGVFVEAAPVYEYDWDEGLRAQEEEYLRSLVDRCAEAGVGARQAVLDGRPADALAEYAEEVGVDLIVMPTHGRGGLSRAWLGSTADGLIRRASVPVLLLRPREGGLALDAERPFGHVLVALDGSELAERALEPAVALGSLVGARYSLVQVVVPAFVIGSPVSPLSVRTDETALEQRRERAVEYLDGAAERLRARGLEVDSAVVINGRPAAGILEHAAEVGADLLALSTHGRGGLSRIALGSVSDKVVRGTDLPVLLYRPEARPSPEAEGASGEA